MTSDHIGIIILAAGDSSRLGTPKQSLKYAGQSLLQHSVEAALDSTARPVVVVLGANADVIKAEIENDQLHVVINAEWEEGMASSIRCGIKTLLKLNPQAEGVIISLCDQPFVTSALLNELVMKFRESGKNIVASHYRETFGPPVFFQKTMFEELLMLKGDTGAKGVISQHAGEVVLVPFPGGSIDIDTKEDYQNLLTDNRES